MESPDNIKPTANFLFSEIDPYFKSLAESIPYYILLVDPLNYKIQYINRIRPSSKMEDIIGKTMFHFVWPEYAELLQATIEKVKTTKKSCKVEMLGTSTNNPENKAWYQSNISVILNEDGSIKHYILTVEDITETKKIEAETINKNEKIKAIINNTRDIICSIDINYNLTEFNAVFASTIKHGYGIDLKHGMPVLQFIDPTRHEHLISIYEDVKAGEIKYDIQSFKTPSGLVVYNETSYHPIYNSDKKITGICIFSRDITERIKSEQKIIAALKEKEILLAEIHHRIKNNLAMVSSLLQLQELNIENEEAKEALAMSQKRIKSTALIHELLYKNESFEKILLQQYLEEVFNYLNTNKNIKLKLEGGEVFLSLTMAMPLGLMLNEIMLNSYKHCYDHTSTGEIIVSTNIEKNKLTINYKDFSGEFPREFDFYNSNTTGLTLIHTFVEQLNGEILLTNRMPANYQILIPVEDAN